MVNDVQFAYSLFSQLVTEYQSHSGAVNTSTTPSVQYGYADGTAGTIRPASMTYPNARVLNYSYGSPEAMDDRLSRIESFIDSDGTTHLADYTRVGIDRTVQVSSPQPGTILTYIKQGAEPVDDGGDQYTGWDRFSRVIDQRWIKTSTGAALERVQYGFDQAGNRQWRDNLVASGGQDEAYTYDGLSQLAKLQRGTLDASHVITSVAWEEDFSFDPTGNWNNYTTKAPPPTVTLNQSRTDNKANEILTISGSSALIAQNAAGNVTKAPKPSDWTSAYDLTYD